MIDPNVAISVIGFVTTIAVTYLNQRSIAKRAREEHEAHAKEIREQLLLASKLADLKMDKQKYELDHRITSSTEHLHGELKKNTDVTLKAFEEASKISNVLTKIQSGGGMS